jgi:hypothetical protein
MQGVDTKNEGLRTLEGEKNVLPLSVLEVGNFVTGSDVRERRNKGR